MTGIQQSPLARLVLFMVCLAIAGSIISGAHYYAVDLPEQDAQAHLSPRNGPEFRSACKICTANCMGKPDEWHCLQTCQLVC